MNYSQAIDAIAKLPQRGIRLGTERMLAFLQAVGLDEVLQAQTSYVHVAGTNGKGSTTAFLQSMMVESGHSSGAFFSPYVVDPRERVQLGRELISKQEFASITTALMESLETFKMSTYGTISEFEFKTALGFAAWSGHNVERVALEVGLGGRYDSTNVVTPNCSVIVSIGWDHMNLLGNSLELIAGEKAGIIKRDRPVVVGRMAEGPRDVILNVARELNSEVWLMDRDIRLSTVAPGAFEVETPRSITLLHPSLYGEIQGHNAALAYSAMELSFDDFSPEIGQRGIASAHIPGRFQRFRAQDRDWILDGAHNVDSAQILVKTLAELGSQPAALLTGMIQGHQPEAFYRIVCPQVGQVRVAPIDFYRALAPELLAEIIGSVHPNVRSSSSLSTAIQTLVESTSAHDTILVTGSFYLVGEVLRFLQPQ